MFVRRASEYGEVVPIGFDAFPALVRSLFSKPEKPQDLAALQSFKHLRPGLDSKKPAAPTPVEIINLVTFGTFNQTRYFNTPSELGYVSGRDKHVDITLDILKNSKTALIHSRLGNGKSIFTSVLAAKAAAAGYKCLLWRRAGRRHAQDLEVISAQGRVLIVFDDYDAAIENIGRISTGLPDAKFVVTVRTGQQEVRLHEIIQKLPAPVKRVNINAFGQSDKEQLLAILDRAGARAEGLEETIRSAHEIREIVTRLYNHSEIREKINGAVGTASPHVTQVVILACLIK